MGSLIPLTLSLPLSRPLGFTHLCRGFPARSIRFIETRSALAFSRCYPRSFTFYLGKPISSIQATGTTVAASMGGVSALSVISLRRNGISTTSAIPTARLPAPSSAKSFAYPALVAIAVVPVGSGIMPEKSRANSFTCHLVAGSAVFRLTNLSPTDQITTLTSELGGDAFRLGSFSILLGREQETPGKGQISYVSIGSSQKQKSVSQKFD